jgi:hypothetical protein
VKLSTSVAALGLASALVATPALAQAPKDDTPGDTPGEGAKKPKDAPATGPAEEIGDDVMRYPPSSVRLPLIIGGSVVTLAAYGLTVASALTWDDVPGADAMLVPVVGPWIALAQNDCAPDDPDCGAILWVRGILLVIDGIAQAGGLGLIGEGIFMTTEADAPDEETKTSWTVAPIVTPTMQGFGVTGTF